MELIVAYMDQRRFPRPLQRKVKRFYKGLFQQTSAMDEATVLGDMPTALKNEVVARFLANVANDRSLHAAWLSRHLLTRHASS